MSSEQDHTITGRDRTLAHLVLATGAEDSSPCPDAVEIALLADGRMRGIRREELWNHLAVCSSCYDTWRLAAEMQQQEVVKKRRRGRILTLGGTLLAAAASIMLFVNIHYSPMPEEVVTDSPSSQEVEGARVRKAVEVRKEQLQQMKRVQSEEVQPRVQATSPRPMLRAMADEDSFAALDKVQTGEILLDINRVIPTVLQKLKQADTGDRIEVRTYKRDRGFSVTKQTDEQVLIREFGYKDQEVTLPLGKLKKSLKTIVKTEFPRSNKVWLRVTTVPVAE